MNWQAGIVVMMAVLLHSRLLVAIVLQPWQKRR